VTVYSQLSFIVPLLDLKKRKKKTQLFLKKKEKNVGML